MRRRAELLTVAAYARRRGVTRHTVVKVIERGWLCEAFEVLL
jgi:hypothetical protein